MLPINYLHERKTMIKSKKNTIGIVKDTICKIALKKANTNCLSLMYEPKKPISLTKGLKYKEYHIFRGKEKEHLCYNF